jgi:nucleoside-diphosphate-sugar epimerase
LPCEFDWVANCVASQGGGVEDYRRIYLEGTRHLMKWLSAKPPQQCVYTSSTSVYGQTDGSWVKETSATEPTADPAKVLLETEELLLKRSGSRGRSPHHSLPAVILRVAGIYGPDRGHWFKQFLKNEARIEGDGSRFLNMIHRDDVVGCVIAALQNGRPGEIYNAVDDEPVRQIDFFQWLAEELGKELPPSVPEDFGEIRKRGVTNKRVSNRKLKSELGYQFKYPDFRIGYTEENSRLEQAGELQE